MASKHKVKPKNRNKPYRPKKEQTTQRQLNEIYKSKGEQGLYDHFSAFKRLTPYELESHWDLFDVDSTINLYCAMNGLDTEADYSIPKHLLESVYKGDLIMALDHRLIYGDQHFHIEIQGTARNALNHDEVVQLPLYKRTFDPAIPYDIFLMGERAGKYYFKRDGQFKTTWKGINSEWSIYLEGLYPGENWELIGAKATLKCTTTFLAWNEEKKFQQLKLLRGVKK